MSIKAKSRKEPTLTITFTGRRDIAAFERLISDASDGDVVADIHAETLDEILKEINQ